MSLRYLISKRNALRFLRLATGSFLFDWKEVAAMFGIKHDVYENPLHRPLEKPVTAIILGAGNRGNVYGGYSILHPDELQIVGVAEPNALRNERFSSMHNIEESKRFNTWEEVFEVEKFADAVIISTPDNLHTEPCLKALELGYNILLEKPIAPTEEECRAILAKAHETNNIVGVCHVLRYAPYFRQIKELLNANAIGKVISVQHMEPIEHIHMSHSYVRGNWHSSKKTAPIILAKSCHDTDIIRWLIDQQTEQIQCFGNLSWFNSKNAPEGSTHRCTDGCKIEHECPYSALQIYHRDKKRLYVFDLPEDKDEWEDAILQQLKTTDYGRCVYRMDNDQPDHLTINMRFKQNITAAFSMEAFTSYEGRRTRIMGSMGDLVGDMETFAMSNFQTGKKTMWSLKTDSHGGGDHRLMKDWVQAVGHQDPSMLSSGLDVSVESHLMAFAAERSRLNNTIEPVTLMKKEYSMAHALHNDQLSGKQLAI